jgi:hypothetical protein
MTGKKKAQNKENSKPCNCPGSSCGLFVHFAGNYADRCGFRIERALACDATGYEKASVAKRRAALLAAVEAPSSPRLNALSDQERANAVIAGIANLNTAIAKVREVAGERTRVTHVAFLVSTGAPGYGGVEKAPDKELERTSLTTRARPSKSKSGKNQRKEGRIGSIVISADGLNYCGVGLPEARALYSNRPATIISDCGHNRELAELVERKLQEYVCTNIIEPNSKWNKRLWRRNGQGGANSTAGPFKVCYGAMIHRPDDVADERYPNASLWSSTLPLDNAVFRDDLLKGAIHTDLIVSAATAAAVVNHTDTDDDISDSDDDRKPAYKRLRRNITDSDDDRKQAAK